MSDIEEIKKNLKTDKLIMGTEETIKALKAGNAIKVYIASNCRDSVKKDIEHYASFENVELVNLDVPNDELGVVCRKPFGISVLCMLK